jgi:hypothetical protein
LDLLNATNASAACFDTMPGLHDYLTVRVLGDVLTYWTISLPISREAISSTLLNQRLGSSPYSLAFA